MYSFIKVSWTFVLLLILFPACSSKNPVVEKTDTDSGKNLATIHQAYVAFDRSNGAAPTCREDLEEYLPKGTSTDVFVSPRDDKEYVIRWGTRIVCDRAADLNVVAYELEGQNGVRFIMTDFGVQQMFDNEFRELDLQ